MNKKIVCASCGKKIISHCNNPKCVEWREQVAQKTIKDCFIKLDSLTQSLTQKNMAGTIEDYKKIKGVQNEVDKLIKERQWSNLSIKTDLESLKNSCRDLTNTYISPKDRKTVNKGKKAIHSPCCTPKNIRLDEESNEFYCDYCWETEDTYFLRSLKSYHINKLDKMMIDNGVSSGELNSSSYQSMLTVPDMFLTQVGIRDTYQAAEQELQTYLKDKKGIVIQTERERERESKFSLSNPNFAQKLWI